MQLATQEIPLSPLEKSQLQEHETTIERGLKTFVEVGNALLAIRDGRLYRATHGTFEDYCQDRWSFSDRYARLLIDAAGVVKNLESGTQVPVLPAYEKHARPLAALSPDDQRTAWREALDTAPNGKLTGAHVASIVEKYKPQPVRYANDPDFDTPPDDAPTPNEPESPAVNRAYKNSSESNEWYTPKHLINLATLTLSEIDLDPASSEVANQTVRARHYFSIEDDGLTRKWLGRVWCNPPYGDDVAKFVEKMVSEYRAGHITEGLLLVAARTDTQWFRKLREFPRCFLWGRVKFIKSETGEEADPAGFPSMVVYFGSRPSHFVEIFEGVGDIYALWGLT